MTVDAKQISSPQYAYAKSVTDDVWSDDSLAAYLSDRTTPVGAVIARATIERPSAGQFVPDADGIIEAMSEDVQGSDYSEWADDFPTASDEAMKELTLLLEPLQAWADRHCSVSFFTVMDPQPYTVTAADIADAEEYRRAEELRATGDNF